MLPCCSCHNILTCPTKYSKKRGSAGNVDPYGELAALFGRRDFRATSTDLVRAELSSNDRLSQFHLNMLMPEMPIGTSHSLSFTVGEYSVHHLLGKGGSGSVYMGSHVRTGEPVVNICAFYFLLACYYYSSFYSSQILNSCVC